MCVYVCGLRSIPPQLDVVGDFSRFIHYVCVFVAASHRESLVQSWCVGELICIP